MRRGDPSLRTLPMLLDQAARSKLSPNDVAIVDEVIRINQELSKLIHPFAGQLDEAVQAHLWRADAHFRVIVLAHERKLEGDVERLRELYVYPEELDAVLTAEVERIRGRCDLLS